MIKSAIISLVLLAAALSAYILKPEFNETAEAPSLERGVPEEFSSWRASASHLIQADLIPRRDGQPGSTIGPYDQVVSRTYFGQNNSAVMLSLAYGRNQRQEQKIHRPEVCYVAQGFKVVDLKPWAVNVPGHKGPIETKRMIVRTDNRLEVVSYWIRIGSEYSDSAVKTRLHILEEGLNGRVPDGILVRASQILPLSADSQQKQKAFEYQERFLVALVEATPAPYKELLVH